MCFSFSKGFAQLRTYLFASSMSQGSQEHHHLLQKSVSERATHGKEKEESTPCIRIGQPKRKLALRLLFFKFPLLI